MTYKKIDTEAEREALLNPRQLANEEAVMNDKVEKNTQEVAKESLRAKLTKFITDTLIKRKRIILFKFWPKNAQSSTWKNYIYAGAAEGNLNEVHLAIHVLDRVGE